MSIERNLTDKVTAMTKNGETPGATAETDAFDKKRPLTIIQIRASTRNKKVLKRGGSYLFLLAGAITMVAPFLWMLTTSLKEPGAVFSFQKNWWEEWLPF